MSRGRRELPPVFCVVWGIVVYVDDFTALLYMTLCTGIVCSQSITIYGDRDMAAAGLLVALGCSPKSSGRGDGAGGMALC